MGLSDRASDELPYTIAKAVGLFVLSLALFDLMAVFIRLMIRQGFSPQELSAYRNTLGILPSVGLMIWTGELRLKGTNLYIPQWKLALFRGGMVALAQLCFFTSIGFLELATISALAQTNALFVVALSVIILGERVGPWRWLAVAIGFTGAMLIIRPGSDTFSVWSLLPIAAALGYGLSMVTVRMFDRSISSALLYVYSAATSATVAFFLAYFTGGFTPITSWLHVGGIFALAMCGGTAVLIQMLAFRMTVPANLAPFTYFGLLFSFTYGWFFFGENPLATLLPGVFLIVGAGALILWRDRIRKPG